MKHCMKLAFLGLLAPCAHAVSENAEVTPINKVIEMLRDMMKKGKAEKHEEEVTFAKFQVFCTETRTNREEAIVKGKDKITSLEASITKAEADADRLGQEIAGLDSDIAGWEAEVKEATAVRRKERSEFQAEYDEYQNSLDAMDRAISTLKSSSKDVPQAAASLLAQPAASQLPATAKSLLLSFAQKTTNDASAFAPPEANAYEFQSSGVIDMLEKLRIRFKDEALALQKEEMNRQHAYDMFMQSVQAGNIAHAKESREQKVTAKAGKIEEAAEDKGDLKETTMSKEEDEAYLADLNSGCHLKSGEFEKRQVVRAEEIKAIEKAIEIISSPDVAGAAKTHLPSALVQEKAGTATALARMKESERHPAQAKAAKLLREHAEKAHSSFLATVAGQVASDPFAKVRKLIKDLLVRLMEEANEEADHKAWCDEELATNKQARDNLSGEVESLTAKVDELTSSVEKLGQEITDLTDELVALDEAMKTATEDRNEEKASNTKTISDAKTAISAVTRAIKVLEEFYSKAAESTALLQGRGKAQLPADSPGTWDSSYTGQQGKSTGVLGMLDVIKSDFARLEAKTSTAEDEAQREYEKFMTDSQVDKAAKDTTLRHKTRKKERTQRELNSAKKELDITHEELQAALDYFDKLKPSCIDSGVTYEDRVAKRKMEIQSLKEALQILEGEDLS